jgi:hypothetical protein
MFLRILRKLLFIPQPLISRNEALQIAYRLVVRIMLSMDDPHIHEGLREWIRKFQLFLKAGGQLFIHGCPLLFLDICYL